MFLTRKNQNYSYVTVVVCYVVCVANSCAQRLSSQRSNSDCYMMKGTTLKIEDTHIDKYLSVNSLEECKKECDLAFLNCKSFSFKEDPDDLLDSNCLLSREDSQSLNTRDSRDFSYDDKYTFYERSDNVDCEKKDIRKNDIRPNTLRDSSDDRDGASRCFRRVTTGKRVANRLVEKNFRTRSRQECEEECLRASFTCRGFNYRYITLSSSQSEDNCELSTQDSFGVDLDDSYVFQRDIDFDFYERTGFGRDCDGSNIRRHGNTGLNPLDKVDRYAATNRFESDNYNKERFNDRFATRDRYSPGTRYSSGVRFNSGVNYGGDRYPPHHHHTENRYHDQGDRYYTRDRYNNNNNYGNYGNTRGDCFKFYQKEARLDSRAIRERLQVRDLQECKEECRVARNFVCRTFSFSYATYSASWFGSDNCYLSDLRANTLDQYDLIYDRAFDIYILEEYSSRRCNDGYSTYDDPYNAYGREDRYETVSGFPCFRGGCQLDRLGKYFFCETDPDGAWDYCCRPSEYCDQSSGYPQRWCYVGVLGNDQWRPCTMNSIGLRSYLKEGEPDSSMLLEDPHKDNSTSHDAVTKHPIEVADITDLG